MPALKLRAGLLAAVLAAAFLALYVRRLCPTLCLTGDSAELVSAAAVWGVPHAPGYPLFTAIGHAFARLPVGEVAWRVHLTSALAHAATVGVVALATYEITRDRVASLAAGVALGLERSFLLGSLYAEVFPLNDLFVALLLLVALRARAHRATPFALALLLGLAAGHHMMVALVVPSVLVLGGGPLASAARRRPLVLLACLLLPLAACYALVPLAASRAPAVDWGDVHDARSFFALVTRHDYGGLFSAVHGAGHGSVAAREGAVGKLILVGFGAPAAAAAALGLIDLLRRQRTVGVAVLLAAVMSGPLFAAMNALGTEGEVALAFFERFTTMCAVPVAIAAGAGVAALHRTLPDGNAARVASLVVLVVWTGFTARGARDVTLRGDWRGIAFAHDLVLETPADSLLLLSGDAPSNAALYVCAIERRCGGRLAIAPGGLFLPWARAQLARSHPDLELPEPPGPMLKRSHEIAAAALPHRPVFVHPDLLEKDPALTTGFAAFPDGLLFRLWPSDSDPTEPRDALIISALRLAAGACEGCAIPPPVMHPSQDLQLTLAYRAAAFNHARAIQRIDPSETALPAALLERAGPYAQGGVSTSRNDSSSSR
jgi:hypothetical protein